MPAAHVSRGGAAQLFRARADFPEEVNHTDSELIGDGDLAKLVRLALTDPDDEVWRYSIRDAGRTIVGNDIRGLREGHVVDPISARPGTRPPACDKAPE